MTVEQEAAAKKSMTAEAMMIMMMILIVIVPFSKRRGDLSLPSSSLNILFVFVSYFKQFNCLLNGRYHHEIFLPSDATTCPLRTSWSFLLGMAGV